MDILVDIIAILLFLCACFLTWSMLQVMDVIKAYTDDLGPLSLDSFRKNNLSSSWNFVGQEISAGKNTTSAQVRITVGLQLKLHAIGLYSWFKKPSCQRQALIHYLCICDFKSKEVAANVKRETSRGKQEDNSHGNIFLETLLIP